MSSLENQVAVVTGGGTGIGRGIVERLIQEKMRVVVSGVDKISSASNQFGTKEIKGFQAARALADRICSDGGEATAIEADVSNTFQVEELVRETVAAYDRLDLFVHNAGVVSSGAVAELSDEDWDSIMTINAKGTFLTNRAAARQMKEQGAGKIVNVSSIAGKKGYPYLAHYCASKFAVIGFTQSLAMELAKDNITVNALCPGIVGTAMWDMLREVFAQPGETAEQSYERNVQAFIPQGIPQTEADMAEAIVFLAKSDHVTGQAICVDGGSVMS